MRYFILLFVLILFSCKESNYIKKYKLLKITPKLTTNSTATNTKLHFTWSAPDSWIVGSPSSMRVGSYKIPYSEGEGDLSITHFPGDAGGIEANVNRWRGQLDLQPLQFDEIIQMSTYGQSMIGSYKLFKIINDKKPSSAFLCSILSAKNSTIFIKLNVSKNGIYELENQFKNFCSSFKYSEEK